MAVSVVWFAVSLCNGRTSINLNRKDEKTGLTFKAKKGVNAAACVSPLRGAKTCSNSAAVGIRPAMAALHTSQPSSIVLHTLVVRLCQSQGLLVCESAWRYCPIPCRKAVAAAWARYLPERLAL